MKRLLLLVVLGVGLGIYFGVAKNAKDARNAKEEPAKTDDPWSNPVHPVQTPPTARPLTPIEQFAIRASSILAAHNVAVTVTATGTTLVFELGTCNEQLLYDLRLLLGGREQLEALGVEDLACATGASVPLHSAKEVERERIGDVVAERLKKAGIGTALVSGDASDVLAVIIEDENSECSKQALVGLRTQLKKEGVADLVSVGFAAMQCGRDGDTLELH